MKYFIAVFIVVMVCAVNCYAAPPHHVQITLVPQSTAIAAGQSLPVAIVETIDPGWHTYWLNPGDAGQAPDVRWTLPPGFTAGALKYPAPERMLEGPLATYGYRNGVALLQIIKAPTPMSRQTVTLTAHIEILVCKDICIPESGDYSLTLNDGPVIDNDAALADVQRHIVDETAGSPATFREEKGALVLTINPPPDSYRAGVPVELLPADWGVVDNAQPASASVEHDALIIRQKRADRALKDVPLFHVLVSIDGKDGPNVKAYNATFAPAALPPASGSLWQAIILALLGGVILNLMPCVFPVLSLKALKLIGLSGPDRSRARRASLFYTGGILIAFGGLAAAIVALRAGGDQAGWGFQLQNPLFVLPLAWLLFLLGLNLSGYFEIGGRFAGIGQRLTGGEGMAASFFTGLLAAIVATPCTTPFMGVAIGYALTQGPAITLAVFLALGFGLALPFMLLSFIPALQRALPRPGHWMVTFRQLLAFPLYLSAAWLVWVVSLQTGGNAVLSALIGAILLAFTVWLLMRRAVWLRWLAVPTALCVVLLLPMVHAVKSDGSNVTAWTPFDAATFAALEKGDDPLFVDMSAAWCLTCKLNEAAVLDTPIITAFFQAHHVKPVRGDWTNRKADIAAYLRANGRDGVPLYVFYGARDKAKGKRPDPVILPQLLTPGIVETTVEGHQ